MATAAGIALSVVVPIACQWHVRSELDRAEVLLSGDGASIARAVDVMLRYRVFAIPSRLVTEYTGATEVERRTALARGYESLSGEAIGVALARDPSGD